MNVWESVAPLKISARFEHLLCMHKATEVVDLIVSMLVWTVDDFEWFFCFCTVPCGSMHSEWANCLLCKCFFLWHGLFQGTMWNASLDLAHWPTKETHNEMSLTLSHKSCSQLGCLLAKTAPCIHPPKETVVSVSLRVAQGHSWTRDFVAWSENEEKDATICRTVQY